MIPSAGIKM